MSYLIVCFGKSICCSSFVNSYFAGFLISLGVGEAKVNSDSLDVLLAQASVASLSRHFILGHHYLSKRQKGEKPTDRHRKRD